MVLEQSIPITANDVRSELTLLRGKNPDVVLAIHVGSILGNILKKARQLGLNQQFLTVNEAEENSVIEAGGDAAEGLTFLSPEPALETSAMKDFTSKYNSKFGHNVHPLTRQSYDATMLVTQAIKNCNGDQKCAKDSIYKIKDYSGASGPFSIQADGGTEREFVIKKVLSGQFVKIAD
jgi:branched-chain amino acid transport system substrate-binding protein